MFMFFLYVIIDFVSVYNVLVDLEGGGGFWGLEKV